MSADNYVVISRGPDGKFRGYMGFASDEVSDEDLIKAGNHIFEADTVMDAVSAVSQEYLEYGWRFVGDDNLGD